MTWALANASKTAAINPVATLSFTNGETISCSALTLTQP